MTRRGSFVHRLTRAAIVALDSLRARCEPSAREVLDVALRLAAWRLGVQDELLERVELLRVTPWIDSFVPLPTPRALISEDVLRALIVVDPELVWGCLVEGVGEREAFSGLVALWRQRLASASAPAALPLDPYWARRLSISDRFYAPLQGDAPAPVRRPELLALIETRAVAELLSLNREFDEGLEEYAETERLFRRRRALGLDERGITTGLRRMGPAFLDIGGAFTALDEAMARPPGAVILGPDAGLRRDLLARWASVRGPAFTLLHEHSPRPYGAPLPESPDNAALRGHVIVFAHDYAAESVRPIPRQATALTGRGNPHRRELARAAIFASHRANDCRMLVATDPEDWAELCLYVPTLRELVVVELLALEASALAEWWACQIPALEDRTRKPIAISKLLREVAARPPSHRRVYGERELATWSSRVGARMWTRRVTRDPAALLTRLHEQGLSELIPDPATLRRVAEIERALTLGCPAREQVRARLARG